jgi:hypothetical protein
MSRKPERKRNDPEQSQWFKDAAKELEADDPKALDRAFKKISPKKSSGLSSSRNEAPPLDHFLNMLGGKDHSAG